MLYNTMAHQLHCNSPSVVLVSQSLNLWDLGLGHSFSSPSQFCLWWIWQHVLIVVLWSNQLWWILQYAIWNLFSYQSSGQCHQSKPMEPFETVPFKMCIEHYDIGSRPVPPNRHSNTQFSLGKADEVYLFTSQECWFRRICWNSHSSCHSYSTWPIQVSTPNLHIKWQMVFQNHFLPINEQSESMICCTTHMISFGKMPTHFSFFGRACTEVIILE